jgi:hypothetical protein
MVAWEVHNKNTDTMKNTNSKNENHKPGRLVPPGFPMLLLLLLFAVPAKAAGKTQGITAGEIALYVVLIVAVIAIAWFMTMGGKKTQPPTNSGTPHHHHKGHHKHHRR